MVEPKSSEMPDEQPGVPGFRSWGAVYLFVAGMFLLFVAILSILPYLAE